MYETVDEPAVIQMLHDQLEGRGREEEDDSEDEGGEVEEERMVGGPAARQAAKRGRRPSVSIREGEGEGEERIGAGGGVTVDGYRCVIAEMRTMQKKLESSAELAWKVIPPSLLHPPQTLHRPPTLSPPATHSSYLNCPLLQPLISQHASPQAELSPSRPSSPLTPHPSPLASHPIPSPLRLLLEQPLPPHW